MKASDALGRQGTQAELADLVGVSEARVSQIFSDGVVERGATLRAYCAWMREIAAGRASSEIGGLDLVQERAALAREMRIGHAGKNALAHGEYASITLLAFIAYIAAHRRRKQALWQPTDDDRDSFVKFEVDPMLRDVVALKQIIDS